MGKHPKKRPCIFCGKLADSKEDALPKWVRGFVEIPPGADVPTTRQYAGRNYTRFYETVTLIARGRVCQTCNNTWMSDFQHWAKPILAPMITGTRVRIDENAQLIVSAWIVMTAMVLDAESDSDEYFIQDERSALRTIKRLPAGAHVWIARRDSVPVKERGFDVAAIFANENMKLVATEASKAQPGTVFDAHVATFTIGYFIVQLLVYRLADPRKDPGFALDPDIQERWKDATVYLRTPDGYVSWPAVQTLDHLRFIELVHRWR